MRNRVTLKILSYRCEFVPIVCIYNELLYYREKYRETLFFFLKRQCLSLFNKVDSVIDAENRVVLEMLLVNLRYKITLKL